MKMQEKNISENNFEQCIKCTICTVYCPVVPVNPNFPGPKHAGPDGERLRLKKVSFFDDTLKYCLNCKICEVACPSGVKIGDIIQTARIKHNQSLPKLRDVILANTDLMGTVATKMAPIVNTTLGLKPVKLVMDGVLGVDHHRTFPKYTSKTFESWYKKNVAAEQASYKNHISYFHGCSANYNHPEFGRDLITVMNAIGYGVHLLDKEKCCGVALISNGLINQAKRNARHNIKIITKSVVEKNMPVIGTSSTCIFTIRDEYPHLLGLDNSEVRDNVELATRFIYRLVNTGKVKLALKKDYKAKVVYHTPCHMEKLGWSIFSTELIKMIPGVEFKILDRNCCGIAGTYGFKKENYKTSQAIGEPLFNQILKEAPSFVACDCETCKWQIEMSTGVTVKHPISVLAEAIDVEATKKLNKV